MIPEPKILTNLKIEVDGEKVLRRLKKGSREPHPSLVAAVEKELDRAGALIESKVAYVDLEVSSIGEETVELSGEFTLESRSLAKLLSDCFQTTVFVATIGAGLEAQVEREFTAGDEAVGLILDTVGSEAADILARRVQLIIHDRAKREGFPTTGRFSPGYGDLSLSTQPRIVEITKAAEIGISLTESHMLLPRKSVSAIVGWRKE